MKTFIIAEAGVNHNGSLKKALDLVDIAKGSGADAIKFQTFKTDNLVLKNTELANYQKKNLSIDTDQYTMLKSLELSFNDFKKLSDYCSTKEIEFMSTAFDSESLSFLVKKLGVNVLKVPSGELTNIPFIIEHARTGKKLIISTGMGTIDEVKVALAAANYGMQYKESDPQKKDLIESLDIPYEKSKLKEMVTVLHCSSEYPANIENINLKAMKTIRNAFDVNVGYSDHTLGDEVSVAAVALGAKVIEKHFTISRNLDGPDHKASLEPDELTTLIKKIRNIEMAVGNGEKVPSEQEYELRDIARKSLVAEEDIKIGDTFSFSNIAIKRPGTGMRPIKIFNLIGQVSKNAYSCGDLINE
tara:strand:- start:21645 stop:22718 length:1074 start_codon:yes stop_codon:yes gene_type:complete